MQFILTIMVLMDTHAIWFYLCGKKSNVRDLKENLVIMRHVK